MRYGWWIWRTEPSVIWRSNRALPRRMPPSACIGPGKRCAIRWNRRVALVPSMGAWIATVKRQAGRVAAQHQFEWYVGRAGCHDTVRFAAVARQPLQMHTRNTIFWLTGCALGFGLSISLAGYIGIAKSLNIMRTPAPAALVSTVVPLPAPNHDPSKPTVAVLLGNTFTEPTDFLGPYAIFAESGAYNVYAVASTRTVRTLTGGLDLVPHLSFAELAS